jgi:hypothetical protein
MDWIRVWQLLLGQQQQLVGQVLHETRGIKATAVKSTNA